MNVQLLNQERNASGDTSLSPDQVIIIVLFCFNPAFFLTDNFCLL